MYTRVKQISSGLYHLGLGKDGWSDEDGKERVGVYADTRSVNHPPHTTHKVLNLRHHSLNWQLFSHSLARMGHPLTTAYTTLGPEGLQHSLDEPSVRMVFTNSALLGTLEQVVDQCSSLVWVIYDGEDTVDQVRNKASWWQFANLGNPIEYRSETQRQVGCEGKTWTNSQSGRGCGVG